MQKRANLVSIMILWTLTLSWLILIIWESSEVGVLTANTSYRVAEFIASLFHLPTSTISPLDNALRTIMHFVNFFVLGGFVYIVFYKTWPSKKHLTSWVIIICNTIAILDEVKKVFIIGRHLSWPEAGLNCLGVLVGVIFVKLCFWLKYHK